MRPGTRDRAQDGGHQCRYWADGRVSPLSSFATAEARIDAKCGLIALVVGFAFQAVGYLLDLGFGSGSAHSAQRGVTASVVLVIAMSIACGVYVLNRRPMLLALLVEMAHWRVVRSDENPERGTKADPAVLAGWAYTLDIPRQNGESESAYAKRVFGLSDADLIEPEPA